MNLIFTAFANSRTSPLPTLQEEDTSIQSILARAAQHDEFHIHRDQYASVNSITEFLLLYQHNLTVFLYSGHAGRDRLFLEGGEANASGLATLLGACPNLKLVILNGCSTGGQVQALLDAGVPMVVATSAPVEDQKAAKFSVNFFESFFTKNQPIKTAFENGTNAAQIFSSEKIDSHRGMIGLSDLEAKDEKWGLFFKPENEILTEWKMVGGQTDQPEEFEPNALLIEKTWEAIAPFVSARGENLHQKEKIDKIITELPHPISEYLRKLMAKSRPSEKEEIFYHELSPNRLKYLIYSYTTCIELIGFTMLAQIWDETVYNKKPLGENLKTELKTLFSLGMNERKTYSFIPLLKKMQAFYDEKKIEPFITELTDFGKFFDDDSAFLTSCRFIENILKETIDAPINDSHLVKKYCIEIEKNLAVILNKIGFLAKYRMTSMKEINFMKSKHQAAPKFRLNFVDLRYSPSGMDIVTETYADSMDNASVVFIKEKQTGFEYLNLSPFIIDENSFDEKAKLANLCVFRSFEKMANAFTFRYIYKPNDFPLIVRKEKDYFNSLAEQFNAFSNVIFEKDLVPLPV